MVTYVLQVEGGGQLKVNAPNDAKLEVTVYKGEGKNYNIEVTKPKVPNKRRRSRNTKLNWEEVRKIRKMSEEGVQSKEIAPLFGISQTSVSHIINNKTWVE